VTSTRKEIEPLQPLGGGIDWDGGIKGKFRILSTAKLVRWVLLHCTVVLFPSWVTQTVVTPSVDQPPLPILEVSKEYRR